MTALYKPGPGHGLWLTAVSLGLSGLVVGATAGELPGFGLILLALIFLLSASAVHDRAHRRAFEPPHSLWGDREAQRSGAGSTYNLVQAFVIVACAFGAGAAATVALALGDGIFAGVLGIVALLNGLLGLWLIRRTR